MGNAINGFFVPWVFSMLRKDSTPMSNAVLFHKGINKVGLLKYFFTKVIGWHIEILIGLFGTTINTCIVSNWIPYSLERKNIKWIFPFIRIGVQKSLEINHFLTLTNWLHFVGIKAFRPFNNIFPNRWGQVRIIHDNLICIAISNGNPLSGLSLLLNSVLEYGQGAWIGVCTSWTN